jgi:iron complex outermembrane receptor protein
MKGKTRFRARISILATSMALTTMAQAQTAPTTQPTTTTPPATIGDKDIIVTGSSLKGVAPVGSNLTTVGRAELESSGAQTVQQVLKSVPSVVGLQSAGQGAMGSADGSGTNAPTIHGLGASASNSTLILMNGHRIPTSGVNHVLADPNIIAPIALERVEVLADGASSVYGSDAVAGVINFITRKKVTGLEINIQKGFASNYKTFNAGLLTGKTWIPAPSCWPTITRTARTWPPPRAASRARPISPAAAGATSPATAAPRPASPAAAAPITATAPTPPPTATRPRPGICCLPKSATMSTPPCNRMWATGCISRPTSSMPIARMCRM